MEPLKTGETRTKRRKNPLRGLIPAHLTSCIPSDLSEKNLLLTLSVAVNAYELGRKAGKEDLRGAYAIGSLIAPPPVEEGVKLEPERPAVSTARKNDLWYAELVECLNRERPGKNWGLIIKNDQLFGQCLRDNVEPSQRLVDTRLALIAGDPSSSLGFDFGADEGE